MKAEVRRCVAWKDGLRAGGKSARHLADSLNSQDRISVFNGVTTCYRFVSKGRLWKNSTQKKSDFSVEKFVERTIKSNRDCPLFTVLCTRVRHERRKIIVASSPGGRPITGSCRKRQKPQAPTPQAPIRNRQTRKVANAKVLN